MENEDIRGKVSVRSTSVARVIGVKLRVENGVTRPEGL